MIITTKNITQLQKGLRENPIHYVFIVNYLTKWDDDVDFDKGTYTNTERVNSGTTAYVRLLAVTNSGEYISNEYNSGNLSQQWEEINYSVSTPTGTAIIIRGRAGNYTGSLGSYSSAYTNNDETNLIGQYIQWKAELTGTAVAIPTLDWVGMNYMTNSITEKNP